MSLRIVRNISLLILGLTLITSSTSAQLSLKPTLVSKSDRKLSPKIPLGPNNLTSKPAALNLNQYDEVKVLVNVNDLNQLSISYTPYGVDNPNKMTTAKIDVNEEICLSAEQILFHRAGAPNTPEAKNNSFSDPQPADFKFYSSDFLGGKPFMGTYGFIKSGVPPYNDNLDPATLDLPDGEVVDVLLYLSFKSECNNKCADANNNCPRHRLNTKSAYLVPNASEDKLMGVLRYNQQPQMGDFPDQLIVMDGTTKFFNMTKASGSLVVKFKAYDGSIDWSE